MILPPPPFFISGKAACAAREGAGEVRLDDPVPLVGSVELRGGLRVVHAGVVDEHVEPAEERDRFPAPSPGTTRAWRSSTGTKAAFGSELRERAFRLLRRRVRRSATAAPAAARPFAMPRPMPPLPPVTSATRPLRSNRLIRVLKDHVRPLLADHDDRGVGVARDDARHDRAVEATRRPSTPYTFSRGSTTARSSMPMRHEELG